MKNKTVTGKIKKVLEKLGFILFCYVPSFLVAVSLFWVAFLSAQFFSNENNFSQILVMYAAAIAVSIAMSSAIFTYVQCNHGERNKLIRIGQLFLYASISMIMALLISWLSFEARKLIQDLAFYDITVHFVNIIFFSNFMFFVFSALSFGVGLEKLEKHLYFQVKEDI